jgi:hypothetical protein
MNIPIPPFSVTAWVAFSLLGVPSTWRTREVVLRRRFSTVSASLEIREGLNADSAESAPGEKGPKMPGNPSAKKRQRELLRQEQQREKVARRAARKAERDARGPVTEGQDPDLIGIVPGPQQGEEEL